MTGMLEGRINDLFERVAINSQELHDKFSDVLDKNVLVFARDNYVFLGTAISIEGNHTLTLWPNVTQLSPEFKTATVFMGYKIPGSVIEEVYVMKQPKTQVIDTQTAPATVSLPLPELKSDSKLP